MPSATTTDDGTRLDGVLDHRPAYAAAYRAVLTELWAQHAIDPVTLELCRIRVAQLLGCDEAAAERTPAAIAAGLDEELVARLAEWPTSERFDARLRACLGLAEQVLLDAQGVSDEQAANVIAAVGEAGFLVLTYACGLFETNQRARILLA